MASAFLRDPKHSTIKEQYAKEYEGLAGLSLAEAIKTGKPEAIVSVALTDDVVTNAIGIP